MSDHQAQHPRPDDVYPVHRFDGHRGKQFFVARIMRFNDVLDVEMLRTSLSALLELGDWRKLGGRLRITDTKSLELHVPKQFDEERPAIWFSKEDFSSISIYEHELASQLPEPRERPYTKVMRENAGLQHFAVPEDYPQTVQEMVERELPQLSLRTTSFKDATLVSLAWSHILMDAMGRNALMESWSLLLAGRHADISNVLGAKQDVLKQLDILPQPAPPSSIASRCKRLLTLGCFVARFHLHKHFYPPDETRILFIPRSAVDKMKQAAEEEAYGTFVSEGDVITAWICKAIASTETTPHPLTIVTLVNVRGRLSWMLNMEGVYLQNMHAFATVHLTAKQSAASIGQIAVEHRRQLTAQTSEAQLTLLLQDMWQRIGAHRSVWPAFVREPNARLLIVNNLSKLSLAHATDFGPAVIRQELTRSAQNPPGTIVSNLRLVLGYTAKPADTFEIDDKDQAGNCWVVATLSRQVWAKVDEALESPNGN